MKKMLLPFLLLFLVNSIFPVPQEKSDEVKVTEDVAVHWWVVPFFAVGKDGRSIMDLKPGDIELLFDGTPVTGLQLFRKEFYSDEKEDLQEKKRIPAQKRYVFLLFDCTLSNASTINRSKILATRLIDQSGDSNYFILMSIEPFKGLTYIEGPSNDKGLILEKMKKKIHSKYRRVVMPRQSAASSVTGGMQQMRLNEVSENARSSGYFHSLRTLHYALKTIKDNKFVYFFTQGVKNIRSFGRGMISHHLHLLETVGQLINRSGAVLFIINPSGFLESGSSFGKLSMRYLADTSGGEYLEGNNELVAQRVENINQAYYELAFPDSPGYKGDSHKIALKSRNKEVKIYSLRALSRGKDYPKMDRLEREILVLNIVENGYLAKSKLSIFPAREVAKSSVKGKYKLTFELPAGFLNSEIDVYRVWINDREKDAKMTSKCVVPDKNEIIVELEKKKGYQECVVIVKGSANQALLYKI